jgi:GT2 family glycosyltransferase
MEEEDHVVQPAHLMPSATVIIPTRRRAPYLDVALGSIAPQARAAGAELLVVDDGGDAPTQEVAARHGAEVLVLEEAPGLNAARNAGAARARGGLLVYVDDDVRVRPGWLAALLEADEREAPEVGVFTGPILARIEDHAYRTCGREGPPITFFDLGPADADAPHAWGANMAVRRSAYERIGPFDESIGGSGDEIEWQTRLLGAGGRVRYIAAAALEHRRAGDDARLRSLARAAFFRGRAGRRFDGLKGTSPSLAAELRTLAACIVHGPLRLCMNGPVLAAHSAGRLREALAPEPSPATPGVDDFLAGRSGTVGGRRDVVRRIADAALDLEALRRRRPAGERRRVLVVGIRRPERLMEAAVAELQRSRHDVTVRVVDMDGRGKFERMRAVLQEMPDEVARADWLLLVDDDVELPRGFLDRFLASAEAAGLRMAQPAHRRRSHAAWPVTRRRPGQDVRRTRFVEIGPVTALHRDTFGVLLPFPPLSMGWGLDVHWGAVAAQHGWPVGVVDATPVRHTAPAGGAYGRDVPIAEARAFLAERPYVRRSEAAWSEPAKTAKTASSLAVVSQSDATAGIRRRRRRS